MIALTTATDARTELLAQARERLHLPGELDTSARLAANNLAYGLGRILAAVREYGSSADARFVGSADFTITRTSIRWIAGFAYGGLLALEGLETDLVFPELRPNTCGCLVGELRRELSPRDFIRSVAKVRFASDRANWDYGRRNHFINLYRSRRTGRQVFIVHGCLSYLKSDTKEGKGLFAESSKYWRARVQVLPTPLGDIQVLVDRDAQKFWKNYLRCEKLTKADRVRVAGEMFGDFEVLGNETHEGMSSPVTYLQGCHSPRTVSEEYPVLSDIGQPAYLVTAGPEPEGAGIVPRGCVGLLPHGTGYSLELGGGKIEVLEDVGPRPIFCWYREGSPMQAFADVAHIPYRYRSASLIRKWADDGRITITDELAPEAFTKL